MFVISAFAAQRFRKIIELSIKSGEEKNSNCAAGIQANVNIVGLCSYVHLTV